MDQIYLDNNSTTPLLPAVWDAMQPYMTEVYGNPASAHRTGSRARKALEAARARAAALLGAHPDEVLFTSGATEANNLAIFGLAGDPPGRIAVSPIEHPSVTEPVEELGRVGFAIDRLPVDGSGMVNADDLPRFVRPDTRLISIMLANHETGAVEPVAELAKAAGGMPFHCDAVQAAGKIPIDFQKLGVSTLSLSAHKFHGPKGVGALLVRRGVKIRPLMRGGHQHGGLRPGTEPVALAVGLVTALALGHEEMVDRTKKVTKLRQCFLAGLTSAAAPVVINGTANGIPHTINVSFPGCQADILLMNLDLAGIACSTGSACSSGSLQPSPVLKAMGVPAELLHSAMRFSLSPFLSESEVNEAARRIAVVVNRQRAAI
jgi:cysteine desulfurase